jgi:hypothetical protein
MPYLSNTITSNCNRNNIYGKKNDFVKIIVKGHPNIVELNGNRFPCLSKFLSEVPVKIETPTIEIKTPKKVIITKKTKININPKLF